MPLPNERPPLQGVSGMEAATKDSVDRSAEGDREVEQPVEDPGSTFRGEMWAGGAELPLLNGCGKAGAASAERVTPGVRSESGSSGSAGSGKRNGRRRRRSWAPGRIWCRGGTAAVLAHALFHGIGGRGVGDGCFSFVTFLCYFLGAHLIFLGQAWAEGEGELAACRHRADCGQENWVNCTPP